MVIIHYEVYVFESRGWVLHSRYPQDERAVAIEEAHNLERHLRLFVRVFSETYNSDDSSVEELEVYSSADAPAFTSSAGRSYPKGSGAVAGEGTVYYPDLTPFSAKSGPRKKHIGAVEVAASTQVAVRMVSIAALALVGAGVLVAMVPNVVEMLWHLGFQIKIPQSVYGRILFLVFVITFLTIAVPLSIRFLPRLNFSFGRNDEEDEQEEQYRERDLRKSLDLLAERALKEQEAKRKKQAEGKPPETPSPEAVEEAWEADPNAPTPEELGLPPLEMDEPEVVVDMDEPEKASTPPEETPPSPPPPPDVNSLGPALRRFIDGTVAVAQRVVRQMDSYNRFALHLYAMGAVESLCEHHHLDNKARETLASMALNTLGTHSPLAEKFQEKLGEYLLEPRYLAVVQAGRNAMHDALSGREAEAHRLLKDVFTNWNGRNERKGQSQTTTIMFTDIVASTSLTQALGDATAQTIIRRYNGIVRSVLSQYNGREIKHTGDGLMASFSSAVDAANAAIAMQRQTADYNTNTVDPPQRIRIGLNAGEPIEEDGDLFGSTVQLAARICAAAGAEQILCSAVVRDLSGGKGLTFQSQGGVNLKGFDAPQVLYEIVWRS